MKFKLPIKTKGFTLLEMLIVLTIVAIILPTVFAVVFVIMRQQVRIYRVVETRRQGDYILSFIKDKLIRSQQMNNHPAPYSTIHCSAAGSDFEDFSNGNNISFLDRDNVTRYRIYLDTATNNLNYEKVLPAPALTTVLNNTSVAITNFEIKCYRRGTYSSPLISISYDVTFIDTTFTVQEGTSTFHYQTKIRLRDI